MSQTIRAFVAVEINSAVRQAAEKLIEELRAAAADVKWVATENLHLTLKFLGDVPLVETARICEALQRAAADVEPFEIELAGAGAFPNVARPRTVWLGSRGDDKPILSLFKQVEERLQKLGFRKESRRFQSHLTLGRVRGGGPALGQLGELLSENADYEAGTTWVGEVVLFSSRLTSEGPIYAPLGRAKLGG